VLQLFYSVEDENRQRAGQPPIVVNVPRESLAAQPVAQDARTAAKASNGKVDKKPPAKSAGRKVAATKSAKSANKPSKPAKKK